MNWGGRVHGGTVLKWIDDAARACAESWTSEPVVGVYAGGIHFHAPIEVGQLVEVESRVLHVTATEIHVATHVRSATVTSGQFITTTRSMSIFGPSRPHDVDQRFPRLPLQNDEDLRLAQHARDLIALRAELDSVE